MSIKNFTLYGIQASLYTGKVRAYMRRNRIPVIERGTGHPQYLSKIYPHMQRFIMPVIVTPEGEIIQDGTDILDYLEEQGFGVEPLYPENSVMKALALLFELFGNQGLLRPAMHYRWNFDVDNLDFLKVSFVDALPAHLDAAGKADAFDHVSGRLRKATMAFGVFSQTYEAVEKSYAEFLSLLNAHLSQTYYLFGNAPTIGDYGLFNPLYAHLARDPKPAFLMKTMAPFVWNWVERMNRPEQADEHTIYNPPTSLFIADRLPESLNKLMHYMSMEYAPELSAHVDCANHWLAEQDGSIEKIKAPLGKGMGLAEFKWRGHSIRTVVWPYSFYLLQRLQDHFDDCSPSQKTAIRELFAAAGLEGFLDKRVHARVIRENYHEFWVR